MPLHPMVRRRMVAIRDKVARIEPLAESLMDMQVGLHSDEFVVPDDLRSPAYALAGAIRQLDAAAQQIGYILDILALYGDRDTPMERDPCCGSGGACSGQGAQPIVADAVVDGVGDADDPEAIAGRALDARLEGMPPWRFDLARGLVVDAANEAPGRNADRAAEYADNVVDGAFGGDVDGLDSDVDALQVLNAALCREVMRAAVAGSRAMHTPSSLHGELTGHVRVPHAASREGTKP
jgi:hypothetical protein